MRPMRNGLTEAVLAGRRPVAVRDRLRSVPRPPSLDALPHRAAGGPRRSRHVAGGRAHRDDQRAAWPRFCAAWKPRSRPRKRARRCTRSSAALPPGVFVDPELRRDPDAVVTEALTVLVRLGILRRGGAALPAHRCARRCALSARRRYGRLSAQHARRNARRGGAPGMTRVIALLRAVNVGGTGKIAMADVVQAADRARFRAA